VASGGTHEFSTLKQAYMEFAGVKLRTAQVHAKTKNPRWLEFLAANGYSGGVDSSVKEALVIESSMEVLPPENASASPGIPSKPMADEFLEDKMLREHRELWQAAVDQARAATLRGDAVSAMMFSKLASSHLAACERAKITADKAAIVRRTLIPGSEWQSLCELVQRMAANVTGLDRELADKCNPENPSVAALAIRNWFDHRWNPSVDAVVALFT
jgi:hypothetical protein